MQRIMVCLKKNKLRAYFIEGDPALELLLCTFQNGWINWKVCQHMSPMRPYLQQSFQLYFGATLRALDSINGGNFKQSQAHIKPRKTL